MATAQPSSSPAVLSDAMSLASWAQLVPVRKKTYAAPASAPAVASSAQAAPMSARSPDSATEMPKMSPDAASEATILACSLQLVPDRTKT